MECFACICVCFASCSISTDKSWLVMSGRWTVRLCTSRRSEVVMVLCWEWAASLNCLEKSWEVITRKNFTRTDILKKRQQSLCKNYLSGTVYFCEFSILILFSKEKIIWFHFQLHFFCIKKSKCYYYIFKR